eukprot:Rmarinus@m.1269
MASQFVALSRASLRRSVRSYATNASQGPSPKKSRKIWVLGGLVSTAALGTAMYADAREGSVIDAKLWELTHLLFHRMGPEDAHSWAIRFLSTGLFPLVRDRSDSQYQSLKSQIWGIDFANPIGLAAGFDKNANAPSALLDMGFGFVEVGSVTPLPQPGNPTPRFFRLEEDGAVINRYGFNSDGIEKVRDRLASGMPRDRTRGLVGVNLGKNKTSPSAVEDYTQGVIRLGEYADFLVVNISSPNTPGLRSLQRRDELSSLLSSVLRAARELPHRPPVLVKIAPDLTSQEKEDIADVVLKLGIDGIVISNTTISRPDSLISDAKHESGGLSGKPLMEMSTEVLADMYRLTGGKVPLVGVGGVSSGADAYRKVRAGASLVELLTAFGYEGPPLIPRIKAELHALLRADGFSCVSEAVGADVREENDKKK